MVSKGESILCMCMTGLYASQTRVIGLVLLNTGEVPAHATGLADIKR